MFKIVFKKMLLLHSYAGLINVLNGLIWKYLKSKFCLNNVQGDSGKLKKLNIIMKKIF